jgi:hypothetical protein
MTVIILKLVKDIRCEGCGAIHRHVDRKSHLCLYCMGWKLGMAEIQQNLESTLRARFAPLGEQIRKQLAEFRNTPNTR